MVKLVLIPSQLRMDSFLRCGSESSRFGAGIWVSTFLHKMPRRVVQTHPPKPKSDFGNEWKPQRERKRAHSVLLLFYFSKGLAYQRRFEAIRETRAAQWHQWSGQDVSGCLEGCPSSGERSDMWPSWDDATGRRAEIVPWSPPMDPRPFGIHLDVSCSQSLLCSLSHSAFCISNHSLFVALLRCLSFPVAFAICSTATPVVIHFPGGPFNDYNPTLRLDQVLRLAMVLRPVQAGPCTTEVLLDPSLQNVIMRGCCFYQHGWQVQEGCLAKRRYSIKGPTKGHVIVSGLGLTDTSIRHKNLNLVVHWGFQRKRGRPVEWVEKYSFDWLNKLFVISASERNHETLLSVGVRQTPRVEEFPFIRGSPGDRRKGKARPARSKIEKTLGGDFEISSKHRDSPNRELEPVVPCIILKPEEEEEEEKEMALNLRTEFKERHHKRLSEALPAAPLFAKKIRPEAFREKPVPDSPTTQTPTATPGGDINEKDTLISSPSREEIAVLLKKVSCFITPKPPTLGIDALFPLTHRHFVDLLGDPRISGVGVANIRNLMQQQSLLFKWLEVVKTMLAFFTQRIDNDEELRTQLVRVKSELLLLFKRLEVAKTMLAFLTQQIDNNEELRTQLVEARRMREENEVTEAKCRNAEQERDQLKKELEKLWAVFEA
ncbi:hypothetical protein CK203_092159 [Vitis vinifera]|uniref:Uncharacterized protein n=1 Tax=Vitis vinifera TaxID=29760 RepID=A0A438DG29_VITVI|nr:hypothetical protein CK203_092159 [Vitis vinifera]